MIIKKKFKLIKEYPGSPVIGTIHEVDFYDGNIMTNKSWELIHLYPEFWEEVKEKDYEVVSFLYVKDEDSTLKGKLLVKKENGLFQWEHKNYIGNASEENLIKMNSYIIHSVKRLSDGEFFTVGDILSNGEAIKSIGLIEGKIRIYPQFSFYKLKDAIKSIKVPLFTTEDGKKMYERDVYFIVTKQDYSYCNAVASNKGTFTDRVLRFSTRELAKEWIIMNKPCLSINDLLEMEVAKGISLVNKNSNFILTAKTVVEQKLK